MKYAYAKGAAFERHLIRFLSYKGFSVSRTASSGGHLYPVDIIAIKKGLVLAFECKAHKTKPRLERKKFESFRKWCDNAGAIGFLAWRAPQNRWLFLGMKDIEKSNYADDNWIEMENFLRAINFK